MNKYLVKWSEVNEYEVPVIAENEDEACHKASEIPLDILEKEYWLDNDSTDGITAYRAKSFEEYGHDKDYDTYINMQKSDMEYLKERFKYEIGNINSERDVTNLLASPLIEEMFEKLDSNHRKALFKELVSDAKEYKINEQRRNRDLLKGDLDAIFEAEYVFINNLDELKNNKFKGDFAISFDAYDNGHFDLSCNGIDDFINQIEMLNDSYDVDEEVKIWLGGNGSPEARELVENFQGIQINLNTLSEDLYAWRRESSFYKQYKDKEQARKSSVENYDIGKCAKSVSNNINENYSKNTKLEER